MQGITSKVYKTIKAYLRHNPYRRLTARKSRVIKLGRRSWRVKIARPIIKLQSKVVNSPTRPLNTVLVFLSGGETGLVSGLRNGTKCVDSQVCARKSPISRQISANDCEFKRKTMLNFHIPELLPRQRSYPEKQGFAALRAVHHSVQISVAG